MARVQALAQAAMSSDPKSAVVQRFHDLVQEDRRNVLRTQVGLYAALERREAETRARREVAAELEARRRAARRHQVPPIAPLGAGAILLTLGIMAWNHGLKDEAQRRADETKRVAAAGLIILGCAGISYGASAMIFSAAEAAPVLEPAVAGAGGARVIGPVLRWGRAGFDAVKAGAITLAAMAGIKSAVDASPRARLASESGKDVRASGEGMNAPSTPPQPGAGPVFLPLPIGAKPDGKDCSLRQGEDVLDRFIDGTRLAPGFLLKHEGPGHTRAKHVGKKLEYLQRRLRVEGVDDASTFFDDATAERVISHAIKTNLAAITAWFATPLSKSEHRSFYSGSHLQPIGNSVSSQNPNVLVPKYDARARLLRTESCQIYILTAYPE